MTGLKLQVAVNEPLTSTATLFTHPAILFFLKKKVTRPGPLTIEERVVVEPLAKEPEKVGCEIVPIVTESPT